MNAQPAAPLQPEISVVIPTYNEEDNVVQITEAVIAVLTPVVRDFEIVIIDNASQDRTVALIRELCAKYSFVRCIVNTRNFGQMRSPTHAIFACRGKAIIGICADFQDPPEMLPQFVVHWRAGAKIVLAVRQAEQAGAALRTMRKFSYEILSRLGEVRTVNGATGFGLYDAKVVDIVKKWNDPEPFFRAMLVETGFAITTIPFERPPRERGQSKNNWKALTAFALSALPLISRNVFRVAFSTSLAFVCIGGLLALLSMPAALLTTKWTMIGVTGIGMLLLGCVAALISMLGIQLTAVSDRVRHVGLVVEQERINFNRP
jgi:polyisoprenyl-phosphate glycosyltransferase